MSFSIDNFKSLILKPKSPSRNSRIEMRLIDRVHECMAICNYSEFKSIQVNMESFHGFNHRQPARSCGSWSQPYALTDCNMLPQFRNQKIVSAIKLHLRAQRSLRQCVILSLKQSYRGLKSDRQSIYVSAIKTLPNMCYQN